VKCELPKGVDYVINQIFPQEVEGGVAEAGQRVAASGIPNAAVVFAEMDVAVVVQRLDSPVASPEGEQQRGVGDFAGEAGDGVNHLHGFFAGLFGCAGELADLS
jgi:hypothetical protein